MLKIFLLFFILLPVSLFAEGEFPALGPLAHRIQHPVYLQSLSPSPDRPTVLPRGGFEVRVDSSFSNLYEFGATATDLVELDMELLREALVFKWGWFDAFEASVEIPLYHTEGGFLDRFIDSYHTAFGLPRGGRELVGHDSFTSRFISNGGTTFDYPAASLAFGDIALRVKHHVIEEGERMPAWGWFFDVKLPTGEVQKGVSSGSADAGLGVAVEKGFGRIHLYVNAEGILVGEHPGFDEFTSDQMFAYMVAADVSIFKSWSAIAELVGSTPLLHGTGIDPWDGVPLDLIIGFRGEHERALGRGDFVWQLGFAEDVTALGPSIDFTLFASLGMRFGKILGTSEKGPSASLLSSTPPATYTNVRLGGSPRAASHLDLFERFQKASFSEGPLERDVVSAGLFGK